MSETDQYKEWLASAPTDSALVEAVILEHPSWTPTELYLINWDRSVDLSYQDRDGTPVTNTFEVARFTMEQAALEDSLQQTTRVGISAAEGAIHDYINNMDVDARAIPIKMRVLSYLDTDFTTPVLNWPYPIWTIDAVTSTHEVAVADLGVPQLRVRRIGRYFTRLELPVLGYL